MANDRQAVAVPVPAENRELRSHPRATEVTEIITNMLLRAQRGLRPQPKRVSRRFHRLTQPGLRPEPRVPRAKHAKSAKRKKTKEQDKIRFALGDLRVFARDISCFTLVAYDVAPELSGSVFQLLRVTNADSEPPTGYRYPC